MNTMENEYDKLKEKVRESAQKAGRKYWYVPFFRFAEVFGEKELVEQMRTDAGSGLVMQELYGTNLGYCGAAVEYFEKMLHDEQSRTEPDPAAVTDLKSVLESLDHTIICMTDALELENREEVFL